MVNEWKKRWKAESPLFFEKIKNASILIFSSALAVWTANQSLNLGLDEITLGVCKYCIAFSAATGLTSKLTVKDPTKL
jgi:hypothetical protein